jgi:rhodanese-related sulfurtransferase
MMKRLIYTVIYSALISAGTLWGVEYGGEKSYLYEIPYKVCPVAPLPEEARKKGVTIVTTQEAAALYKKGAYFYDARRKAHFEQGHVKGAYPVLFDVSKARYTVLSLPKDDATPLVFYCYGETCANSYEAAVAVRDFGYKNIYWYSAGYAAWQKADLPIAK